jgi:hypothetical protein
MTSKERKQYTIALALDLRGAELDIQAAERQALDTFLGYTPAERARCWRAMDERSKRQLVALQLIRSFNEWSAESVDLWVARYDARWA